MQIWATVIYCTVVHDLQFYCWDRYSPLRSVPLGRCLKSTFSSPMYCEEGKLHRPKSSIPPSISISSVKNIKKHQKYQKKSSFFFTFLKIRRHDFQKMSSFNFSNFQLIIGLYQAYYLALTEFTINIKIYHNF